MARQVSNKMKTAQGERQRLAGWDAAEFAAQKGQTAEAGVSLRDNGQAEMAALEGVPIWWESDVLQAGRLQPGASIEDWVKTAGMEFIIRKAAVEYRAGRGAKAEQMVMDDQVVLYRSDNRTPLGIVSPDYNIVQPYEVLEFFRDLVSGSGFELTTAGTLFGGRRYWALAKITEAVIAGWDTVGAYLLLSTSADGTMATEARKTTVRVVCNNTLNMARAANAKAKVSHRVRFDDKKLRTELGLARDDFAAFMDQAVKLSGTKVSYAAAEDFVMRLLTGAAAQAETKEQVLMASPDDSLQSLLARSPNFVPADIEIDDSARARKPRGFDQIMGLFDGEGLGSTKKGSEGTAWGLVNAVTEYVDHHATAKSPDHRIARAWYGTGDALKTEAFDLALKTLG